MPPRRGLPFRAVLLQAKSPKFLILRNADREREFERITVELRDTLGGSTAEGEHKWTDNKPHMALIHENHWYRARATSVPGSVMLIDVYETVEAPMENRRKLPATLEPNKIPAMAIRGHVPDIVPAEGKEWAPEVSLYMDDLQGSTFDLLHRGQERPDLFSSGHTSWQVDLAVPVVVVDGPFAPTRRSKRPLSGELIRLGWAKMKGKEDIVTPPDDFDEECRLQKIRSSRSSSPPPDLSELDLSSVEKEPDTAAPEEPKKVKKKVTIAPEAIKEEDEELNEEYYESMWSRINTWLPPLPPAKRNFKARVTHVCNNGLIVGHTYRRGMDFVKVRDALRRVYSKLDATKRGVWEVGDACVFEMTFGSSLRRKEFVRGRIVCLKERDQTSLVLSIDFGVNCVVPIKDLRVAYEELQHIPALSIWILVKNIVPNTITGVWPSASLDYLHRKIHYTNCDGAVVISPVENQDMNKFPILADGIFQGGNNIGRMMIEYGHAKVGNPMGTELGVQRVKYHLPSWETWVDDDDEEEDEDSEQVN